MNTDAPQGWIFQIDLHEFHYRYWGARDVGSDIAPLNREGCTGKDAGVNKNYTFMQVVKLAKNCGANIIVKNGKGKWYLKRCKKGEIQERIEKQACREKPQRRMYEIEWSC